MGQTEAKKAWAQALLTLALLASGVDAAETDPARRSLVVTAVERAPAR